MKKILRLLAFTFASISIFSCSTPSGNDLKELAKKENELRADRQNVNLATNLDISYQSYLKKYPADSNAPRILFEDAQIDIKPLNKIDAAIGQLETIYTKYPNCRFAMNALFKAAFLNDKQRHFNKAKDEYLMFAKTYPNNELASQARDLASMSGMSDEEQFKQVMTKHALVRDSIKNQKRVQK